MSLRDSFLENLAGDLEYHPRRAAIYLILGALSLCFWIFSPPEGKFTATPLVFALGSIALMLKGVFLLRKSSEGLGLSDQDLEKISDSANRKPLPSLPAQAAQMVQDFGTGSLLLWPLLNVAKDFNAAWENPPRVAVFATGAILFALGWAIRRLIS
jgi:hypothetical protein